MAWVGIVGLGFLALGFIAWLIAMSLFTATSVGPVLGWLAYFCFWDFLPMEILGLILLLVSVIGISLRQ
jgi:hypothetical protein